LKESGRKNGSMDCRGKYAKTANFVMKEMLETGYGKDSKNAQKQLNMRICKLANPNEC
jgi:dsRNA-specific ribonuclease